MPSKGTNTEVDPDTPAASDAQANGSNRRARHRDRRRDEVFAAALALFIDQGYDETTMDEIAQRADVARATVFNHFPRKTSFLDEWTVRRRQRAAVAARAKNVTSTTLAMTLRRYMIEMARLSEETRQETVALMTACLHNINLLAHPALANEMAQFIADAQESGEVRSKVDPGQAGVLTATAYFAVLSQWIEDEPAPIDLEKELLAMVELILFGVLKEPPPSTRGLRRS